MILPEEYKGYDKDNKLVCTYQAGNATDVIDPGAIQRATENLKNTIRSSIKKVSSKLMALEKDADSAIIVEGTKSSDAIDKVTSDFSTLVGELEKMIDGWQLYDAAVKIHDQKQKEANDAARSAVKNTSGVVKVTP